MGKRHPQQTTASVGHADHNLKTCGSLPRLGIEKAVLTGSKQKGKKADAAPHEKHTNTQAKETVGAQRSTALKRLRTVVAKVQVTSLWTA